MRIGVDELADREPVRLLGRCDLGVDHLGSCLSTPRTRGRRSR
jgi:hypothetical protein